MRLRTMRLRSPARLGAALRWSGGAAVLSAALAASAAPPPDPDPLLAPWFQDLSRDWRPGSGARVKCCDIADCRVTQYRTRANHYEVLIDARFPGVRTPSWRRVPPEAVLEHKENPTGGAVACWHKDEVLCFVRPEES